MLLKAGKTNKSHIIFKEYKRHADLILNMVMLPILFLTGNKNKLRELNYL